MNDLLQIQNNFYFKDNTRGMSSFRIPKDSLITSESVRHLIKELSKILDEWKTNPLINGALFSVYYKRIIPKSSRINTLFGANSNRLIRGVTFKNNCHVFTYYMGLKVLENAINALEKTEIILSASFQRTMDFEKFKGLVDDNKSYRNQNSLAITKFLGIISDIAEIESFAINKNTQTSSSESIVSFYKTQRSIQEILFDLGLDVNGIQTRLLDDTTVLLRPEELELLRSKAPYLIAMGLEDINNLKLDHISTNVQDCTLSIPHPTNEPTIGVIDTNFSGDAYFKDWVEYRPYLNPEIPTDDDVLNHGTAVTSIIVDGPTLNPDLDDGCGRFKVKHFAVTTSKKTSSFDLIKKIQRIVNENPQIKVWNLSLGSEREVNENFISPEASILDQLQASKDLVFVISGTNKNPQNKNAKRIGAPADSLNSLVINSCDRSGNVTNYHRCGPVLSFFNKPDVSYFGGTPENGIKVCTGSKIQTVWGTSYAAPWITRKVAYLIYRLNLPREIAKALIIDSAARWNSDSKISTTMGYGIVPQRIEDVISSQDDEIKFFIIGESEHYETFAYNLPVPKANEKFPFFAKATLCYFPPCSRNQGVDYTDVELSLRFGRATETTIKSLDHNNQDSSDARTTEASARRYYRKWDNIKHICEPIKAKARARKTYGKGYWGISLVSKERLKTHKEEPIKFGLVLTLKEMNGNNRYDEFIKLCSFNGWLVQRIIIDQRLNVYQQAETELFFD